MCRVDSEIPKPPSLPLPPRPEPEPAKLPTVVPPSDEGELSTAPWHYAVRSVMCSPSREHRVRHSERRTGACELADDQVDVLPSRPVIGDRDPKTVRAMHRRV